MAYFDELEPIINVAIAELLKNEDICKLVHCYPDALDYRYNPLDEEKIEDTKQLLLKSIYPMPKTPKPEDEAKCFICVNVTGNSYDTSASGYIKVHLMFDIISHLDCWIIKNGVRPLRIVSRIDRIFNNKSIGGLTINKLSTSQLDLTTYASDFYGYRLGYTMNLNSNLVCNLETGDLLW